MAETTETTTVDLDSMTPEQLLAFAKGENPEPTPAPAQTSEPAPAAAPAQEPEKAPAAEPPSEWAVQVDDKRTLNFRTKDELINSYVNAQKLIDKYNGERSSIGDLRNQLQESQARINEMQALVEQLKQGQQQVSAGRQVNQTTQNALSALSGAPANAVSVLAQQVEALTAEIEKAKADKEELAQFANEYKQERSTRQVQGALSELYQEVDKFATRHPEYKLSQSFDQLDDIVTRYGEDAKAKMTPADYDAYTKLYGLIASYRGDGADVDISKKNFNDLEEAWLVSMHRSGQLSKVIADARSAGQQDYDSALAKHGSSATTLPNSVPSRAVKEFDDATVQRYLDMDVTTVKNNPALYKEWVAVMNELGVPIT